MIETSYVEFVELSEKPKTKVYEVRNKTHGHHLGIIKWFGSWRQYCFFPANFPTLSVVFSSGCLHDIEEFIKKLMEERKKEM